MNIQNKDLILTEIQNQYPLSFLEIKNNNLLNEKLFSSFTLELPKTVFTSVQGFVEKIYQIKESHEYHLNIAKNEHLNNWPVTPSLLTCFDFHYSSEMGLKLIEINTNAALYVTSLLQNKAFYNRSMEKEWDLLLEMFKQCFQLKPNDSISILDENPKTEGLYFEFLIFKEWFTNKGYPTNIISRDEYSSAANKNIYNRYNDFYLNKEESKNILDDYISGQRNISPNPREYFLLADKRRLQTIKDILESESSELSQIIPESRLFSEFLDADDLWSKRKKYFFKPSQSFGSKGVYSGKGISRKAFDAIYQPDFMAQEICPADRRLFEMNSEQIELKYDLRFFTFNGKVQHSLARLYQGQATNMRTEFGGIAPIDFK